MRRLTTRVFAAFTAVAIACLAAAGCAWQLPPPKASFTQTASFDRPPKPEDCVMPILNGEPLTAHRRIAIVEAWGADDQQDQVWAALKSKGCETGADALVIVEDQSQVNPDIAKTGLPLTLQDSDGNMGTAKAQGRKKELAPEIGEAGHPGYYLDSIAIVYDNVKADRVHASH